MFMRPTQFAPQITYDPALLGASWKRKARLSPTEARNQFTDWLQRRYPKIAARAAALGVSGLAADDTAPWMETLTKAISQAAPAYAQVQLVKANLDRAKKGLPPLDSSSYAPTVKVQADVDPATRKSINIATIAIGGIAALGALKLLKVI